MTEFLGQQVDVDFRFHEPEAVAQVSTACGLAVEAITERAAYPHEVQTRRGYLLAKRQS